MHANKGMLMKLQAINLHSRIDFSNNFAQNNRQQVNFGFGEDYGDDDFLRDSDHNSNGNIFEFIGSLIEFPIAWIQETIREKREEKKPPKQLDDNEFDVFG